MDLKWKREIKDLFSLKSLVLSLESLEIINEDISIIFINQLSHFIILCSVYFKV